MSNFLANAALALLLLSIGICSVLYLIEDKVREGVFHMWERTLFFFDVFTTVIIVLVPALAILLVTFLGVRLYTHLLEKLHRSRQVHPDKSGLFPLVESGGDFFNYNDPRAQALSVWTAAQARENLRPTPTASEKIAKALTDEWEITKPEPKALGAPENMSIPTKPVYAITKTGDRPTMGIGTDTNMQDVELDLEDLGNVLIAGLPGGGKTNLLATMIAWLTRNDPNGDKVQINIVDLKRVDFSQIPDELKIVALPKAYTLDDAMTTLKTVESEMVRRAAALTVSGAKNLMQHNELTKNVIPYLVTFIDEMVFFTGVPEFAKILRQIASLGRATGTNLVIATQRPSSTLVDTDVRAVFGTRISFRMSTPIDSNMVLGVKGAEKLPGTPGRCIVYDGETRHVQAYDADLKGQFDPFMKSAPKGSSNYEIVDAEWRDVPSEPKVLTPAQWDSWCQERITQDPQMSIRSLATAMALHVGDGRPWENFQSNAHKYLRKYGTRYVR